MSVLNTDRKSYMESPIAPLDLTVSNHERSRSKSRSLRLEGLYLITETTWVIRCC